MQEPSFKGLFARVWRAFRQLDTHLPKSAVYGFIISIVTGLAGTVLYTACLQPEPGDDKPEPMSRAQYAVLVGEIACMEQRQRIYEQSIVDRLPKVPPASVTPQQRFDAIQLMVEYARASRGTAVDMRTRLENKVPPSQFRQEHQEIVDMAALLLRLVDQVDANLPQNMNRPPATVLAEPGLNDRLSKVTQLAATIADTLEKRQYSKEFREIYKCGDPALVVPTIRPQIVNGPLPTLTLGITPFVPPPGWLLTPFVPSSSLPTFLLTPGAATPTPGGRATLATPTPTPQPTQRPTRPSLGR